MDILEDLNQNFPNQAFDSTGNTEKSLQDALNIISAKAYQNKFMEMDLYND